MIEFLTPYVQEEFKDGLAEETLDHFRSMTLEGLEKMLEEAGGTYEAFIDKLKQMKEMVK